MNLMSYEIDENENRVFEDEASLQFFFLSRSSETEFFFYMHK